MNKQFQYILAGSLAALLCATGGALILVWQTMEESRVLEQRNQELQASLEVSRIRVENFCEYPQEALCRVDERTGTVAGAMYDGIPGSPEVMTVVPAKSGMPEIPAASSNANETAEKAEPAMDKSAEKSLADNPPASPEQVKAPAPKPEAVAEPAQPVKLPDLPKEVDAIKQEAPAVIPAPEVTIPVKEMPKVEASAPAVDVPTTKPEPEKVQIENDVPPASYLHEVSGKLSLPPAPKTKSEPKESPKTIAPADNKVGNAVARPVVEKKIQAPQERSVSKPVAAKKHSVPVKKSSVKPAATNLEIRKSWSRVENDGGIFSFTITGSGPSLTTSGALLASPLRYELVLDGLWDVKLHNSIENRLVQNMSVVHKDKNTVVTFHLLGKPYRCSLHRPDARTASVRIR